MKLSRRTLLSTLAISPLLGSKLSAEVSRGEKSLIWVWLGGGISATEFLNPIPNAPAEYRSVTGAVDTMGDYQLGGNFVHLAKIGHKLSPVRSFCHKDASHGSATSWVMNGVPMPSSEGTPQKEPAYGSIVSKLTQPLSNVGVPTYVKINRIQYDEAVWLGSQHGGYEASGEGIRNLTANVEENRFRDRADVVRALDKSNGGWIDMRDQAINIIAGVAGKAFDVNREHPLTLAKYKADSSSLGRSLLLARRLVQNGSKFITIHHGGWDMHANILAGFNDYAPEVDYSLYTLVQDLEQLDMLQNTMIVITSEFSRTPKLNNGLVGQSSVPGRDHWPGVVPLMLIGGDYSRGNVIGTTNSLAEYPTSAPFNPSDLTHTIFDHFGLDKEIKVYDNMGRPRYFVEEESRLIA